MAHDKEYYKRWREKHKDEINARRREKYKADPTFKEKERIRVLNYRRTHREETRKYYNERNNKKVGHANHIAVNAMVAGKIKKMPCEICGDEKSEMHHDDYNRPLEVRWLCKRHHMEWHRNNEPKYLT